MIIILNEFYETVSHYEIIYDNVIYDNISSHDTEIMSHYHGIS